LILQPKALDLLTKVLFLKVLHQEEVGLVLALFLPLLLQKNIHFPFCIVLAGQQPFNRNQEEVLAQEVAFLITL